MVLTFEKANVQKILNHSRASSDHMKPYAQEVCPGLALVADRGVYLMSTGRPGLRRDGTSGSPEEGESFFVAYAREADPYKLPAEEWLAAKSASFGDDDGVEYIPTEKIEGWLRGLQGRCTAHGTERGRILTSQLA